MEGEESSGRGREEPAPTEPDIASELNSDPRTISTLNTAAHLPGRSNRGWSGGRAGDVPRDQPGDWGLAPLPPELGKVSWQIKVRGRGVAWRGRLEKHPLSALTSE